jgi:hypothetical protein
MAEKFLTRPEVAERWRVTPHALDNLATRGQGPRYRRIGRQALYALEDIETYEHARLIDPAARPTRTAA